MVEVLPENGLITALNSSITAGSLTLTIPTSDATIWPSTGEYRVVLWQDALSGPWELIKVVGGQGTATLTVERAAEPYHGVQLARAWPAGTGMAAVMTQDGVYALLQSQKLTTYHQEFVPAASATTVTLSNTPETVLIVAREGVVQSSAAGHYSIAGNVLSFAAAFNGTERVTTSYSVRG